MHLPHLGALDALIPSKLSAMGGPWKLLDRGGRRGVKAGGPLRLGRWTLDRPWVCLAHAAGCRSMPPRTVGSCGNSLKFALLVLVVLLCSAWGRHRPTCCPGRCCPMRSDADPERPAGLFTAWMVMTQKLGQWPLGVSARQTCLSWSGLCGGLAEISPPTGRGRSDPPSAESFLSPSGCLVSGGLCWVMRRWPLSRPVVSQQHQPEDSGGACWPRERLQPIKDNSKVEAWKA